MTASAIDICPVRNLVAEAVNDRQFPSQFSAWNQDTLQLEAHGTHYGYVNAGGASLKWEHGCYELVEGMYFSVPGIVTICGTGTGFVATRLDYLGFFHLGGPTEEQGRLEYIDGCSDSLLIPPVVVGDPCLNLLYLPPNTTQTEHTHPSCRLGMIVGGQGVCRTPSGDIELSPGNVFRIAPDALHSFHTRMHPLRVVAWHPDSDFGPTDSNHPMINRTIIKGVSAAQNLSGAR